MNHLRVTLCLSVTALLVLVMPVHAGAPPDAPRALVTDASSRIVELAKRIETQSALNQAVTEVLSEIVDFPAFSARTLKGHWGGLTEPQRVRFNKAFRALILSVYTKRFKPGMDFSVTFRGATEKVDASHATVRTTLHGPKVGVDVDYEMHAVKVAGSLSWRVIDLTIDEVSMVRNWRRSFVSIMERDGYEVLVTKIEKRARRP